MAVSGEQDRDSWVRITLRLPPDLHAKIVTRAGVVSLNSTIVGLLDDALNINEAEKAIQALLVEQELTRKIITDQMDQLSSHMTTMHKELSQRTDQTASSVQSMRDEIFPVIRKSDTNITLSRAKPKAPG